MPQRSVLQRRLVSDYLLYPYGKWRHGRLVAQTTERNPTHSYTSFLRVPGQYEALLGPVLDHLGVDPTRGRTDGELQITVLAGSTGAEAYTIAAVLAHAVPDLAFRMDCSDLGEDNIERARQATYSRADVNRSRLPVNLSAVMFEPGGDNLTVQSGIRERVTFATADIVDGDLTTVHAPSDLIFAQNVFCHLTSSQSERAMANIVQLAKPRSALFLDGMPLDLRVRLTEKHGLQPLRFRVGAIHSQARRHVPTKWWERYYGFEPFMPLRRDWLRRYATIFLTSEPRP